MSQKGTLLKMALKASSTVRVTKKPTTYATPATSGTQFRPARICSVAKSRYPRSGQMIKPPPAAKIVSTMITLLNKRSFFTAHPSRRASDPIGGRITNRPPPRQERFGNAEG